MEGHELRRLRMAHGLSRSQLAEMLEVSPADVSRWEASPDGEDAAAITPEMRRLVLRALAMWREAQKRRTWLVILLSGDRTPAAGARDRSAAARPPLPAAMPQAFAVKVR